MSAPQLSHKAMADILATITGEHAGCDDSHARLVRKLIPMLDQLAAMEPNTRSKAYRDLKYQIVFLSLYEQEPK